MGREAVSVGRLSEAAVKAVREACNRYDSLSGDCELLVLMPILRALALAVQEAQKRKDAEAIQEACGMCNGKGYTETSRADHGCDGDESVCASRCPVERSEQEGCEYCGRPIAALREQPIGDRAKEREGE